ncbi:MAG: hypothetical protein LBI77_00830, partial [Puniceicoccales bacterium]|nr:hypothetical protein [Puniceicoccales bacterium]
MLKKYINFTVKQEKFRKLSNDPEECIDFSTNDYLSLSKNREVIEAGCKAAQQYGSGSTGSRLLSGNKPLFVEFEKII